MTSTEYIPDLQVRIVKKIVHVLDHLQNHQSVQNQKLIMLSWELKTYVYDVVEITTQQNNEALTPSHSNVKHVFKKYV